MFGRVTYWSENEIPGVGDHYDVVDPYTKEILPYVKSVDLELGIVEEVLFDGFMENGRPRPRIKYGRPVTRTRQMHFDLIEKRSRVVVYRIRR
jgi:hypothetical protein